MRWVDDCCKLVVMEINNLGVTTTKSTETVGEWNSCFHKNGRNPHPDPHVRMGKKPKHPISEIFLRLEARVKDFIVKYLTDLLWGFSGTS